MLFNNSVTAAGEDGGLGAEEEESLARLALDIRSVDTYYIHACASIQRHWIKVLTVWHVYM
jgi:hypothetical protein